MSGHVTDLQTRHLELVEWPWKLRTDEESLELQEALTRLDQLESQLEEQHGCSLFHAVPVRCKHCSPVPSKHIEEHPETMQ